jgi:ribonuclease HII
MKQGLSTLKLDCDACDVRLDGGLKAPKNFKKQKTIIKGDEKEKIIAWASITAKVSRDALMRRAAKKYPQYGFEVHKGYGTVKHRQAIKRHGMSLIHRRSFCKNAL